MTTTTDREILWDVELTIKPMGRERRARVYHYTVLASTASSALVKAAQEWTHGIPEYHLRIGETRVEPRDSDVVPMGSRTVRV